jgi:predicted phosphodiesterase
MEELSWQLGGVPIVPALGNHDVDSRHKLGADAFKIPRNLSPRFPFSDQATFNKYFLQGFCRLDVTPNLEIIVLNSVVDHLDELTAKKGAFGPPRIAELLEELKSSDKEKVRVALMHHHPLLHSSPVLSDEDVLPSGDQLLSVLDQVGCSFVIHGHKHHPRLTYVSTASGRLPVLAAGSFSALLKELGSRTRNVFHVVEIEFTGTREVMGCVKTWEWRQGEGWVPSSVQSSDFPHITGFGAKLTVDQQKECVVALASNRPERWIFSWEDLRRCGAEVEHLTPAEFLNLAHKLEEVDLRLEARGGGFELARLYTPEG